MTLLIDKFYISTHIGEWYKTANNDKTHIFPTL